MQGSFGAAAVYWGERKANEETILRGEKQTFLWTPTALFRLQLKQEILTFKVWTLGFNTNPAAAAKSLQSGPTLHDPIDGSAPDSPVPGILQARTLEWVAISFSNAWKWKVKGMLLSCVWLLATPWTAAYEAPLSMGFSRQEHWSGLPLPSLSTNPISFQFSTK